MDPYKGRLTTADAALAPLRSGQHVLVGSGAAEPQALVEALADRARSLNDVEVLHLLTLGAAPYASGRFAGRLRHNALFIGSNVRSAVAQGLADYTPCFLSEVPGLLRSGRLPLDVALIQVTPARDGFCSLGVSVDVLRAAIEAAAYVVAQVNPRMPWTEGESRVLVEDIDAFVMAEQPLLELPTPEPTEAARAIGRFVAALVDDGATLQLGIGAVPNAVLASLMDKNDLGIHSEMVSDGILPLLEKGVLTGRAKTLHREKIVTSFCMGGAKLYEAVARPGLFEFRPSDYVNDPAIIARNDRMVAVNGALQVDLTGQVAADSIGHRFYSGFGGQVDFMRGAARSKGGKAVIALPSTAHGGRVSRIVPALTEGTGVVTTRADVDFVITEFGIASLKGKSVRERTVALIELAHPSHRESLMAAAKKAGLVDSKRALSSAAAYPVELECRRRFARDEVFFRPLKPSDEERLKEMFYRQSPETTRLRFGIPLKSLPESQFQKMCLVDYRRSMALAGFVKEGVRERMVAVARYHAAPGEPVAEAAFTVEDPYQGQGIGTFLINYLSWIARERGLQGLRAEVMGINLKMRRMVEREFHKYHEKDLGVDGVAIEVLFKDWKGQGNPASADAAGGRAPLLPSRAARRES